MKTAVVTGASRGIGAAVAERLAADGYAVAVNYNSSEKAAENVCRRINLSGGVAMPFRCDVSKRAEVDNMFAAVRNELGTVSVLVNNAGIAEQCLFTDISEHMWDRLFDVNVKGAFNCSQAAVKEMISAKSGNIVNISSMWGQVGASCEVHYSAAKAALIGFTKALAKELGPSGIRVNCIAPGLISTEMNSHLDEDTINALVDETPLSRVGTAEDIANAVSFLVSEKASFITGDVLTVNGGMVI